MTDQGVAMEELLVGSKNKKKAMTTIKQQKEWWMKRKRTLLNKGHELKTLCGVDLGMIIFPPPGQEHDVSPQIWPDPLSVEQIIESYRNPPKNKSGPIKRKQPDCASSSGAAKRQKTEYPVWDPCYDDLPMEKLKEIQGFLEEKISNIRARCEILKMEMKKKKSNDVTAGVGSEEEAQIDHTLALPSSGGYVIPPYSYQNNTTCSNDHLLGEREEQYMYGGFEENIVVAPPALVSIGAEEDFGMTMIPNCYNNDNNPYLYNYNSSMLCGGCDYGSATLMTGEEGPLEGWCYYSLPPPDLCY